MVIIPGDYHCCRLTNKVEDRDVGRPQAEPNRKAVAKEGEGSLPPAALHAAGPRAPADVIPPVVPARPGPAIADGRRQEEGRGRQRAGLVVSDEHCARRACIRNCAWCIASHRAWEALSCERNRILASRLVGKRVRKARRLTLKVPLGCTSEAAGVWRLDVRSRRGPKGRLDAHLLPTRADGTAGRAVGIASTVCAPTHLLLIGLCTFFIACGVPQGGRRGPTPPAQDGDGFCPCGGWRRRPRSRKRPRDGKPAMLNAAVELSPAQAHLGAPRRPGSHGGGWHACSLVPFVAIGGAGAFPRHCGAERMQAAASPVRDTPASAWIPAELSVVALRAQQGPKGSERFSSMHCV